MTAEGQADDARRIGCSKVRARIPIALEDARMIVCAGMHPCHQPSDGSESPSSLVTSTSKCASCIRLNNARLQTRCTSIPSIYGSVVDPNAVACRLDRVLPSPAAFDVDTTFRIAGRCAPAVSHRSGI